MQEASLYVALGGSRRAYYDLTRRQVISRRQYLKRHGVFPAGGKRRTSCGTTQAVHRSTTERLQPFTKKVELPHGNVAEIHLLGADTSVVVIRQVRVVSLHLEQRGKRRMWHCGGAGCPNHYENLRRMANHCYESHYLDACQLAGVAALPILPVHDIPTRSRKSRMPWRVDAPELSL